MEALQEIRKCKECNAKLVGRTDQKYCDNMCRTSANNRRRFEEAKNKPECIASIQKTLLNNYRILTELKKRGQQFSKLYLQDLGFSFRYMTSTVVHEGSRLYFCFNHGYVVNGDSIRLLMETVPLEIS